MSSNRNSSPQTSASSDQRGPSGIELLFLIAAALMIFGSSWLLGARHPWSQWTLLGMGSLLLVAGAGLYRQRSNTGRIGGRAWWGWKVSAGALLFFVAYVGIQSANISSTPEIVENDCRLIPKEHIAWLPSSVGGEFDGMVHGMIHTENAARYLLVYSAAALGALGLVLGVQSASTLNRIIGILLVHGLVSSLVCIAHQISGSTKVLWIEGDPLQFLGSPFFFNKNQNAAYQTLLSAWMLSWSAASWRNRPWSSLVLSTAAVGGLIAIRSRAGLVFACVLLAMWLWESRHGLYGFLRKNAAAGTACLLAAAVALGAVFSYSGGATTVDRLATKENPISYVIHGDTFRRLLHEVALEMVADKPWLGWGAAGYFYAYASYETRVPEMVQNRVNFRYFRLLPSADGDWYQFLVEFGIVGTALFAAIFLPHLIRWLAVVASRRTTEILPMLASLLLLYHGLIDQTFRNSGLLFLFLATTFLVTKSSLLKASSAR